MFLNYSKFLTIFMTLYKLHTEKNRWTKCLIAQRKMIEAMGREVDNPLSNNSYVALGGIFHLAKIPPNSK